MNCSKNSDWDNDNNKFGKEHFLHFSAWLFKIIYKKNDMLRINLIILLYSILTYLIILLYKNKS